MFFSSPFTADYVLYNNHDNKKYYCILKFLYSKLQTIISKHNSWNSWFRLEWYIGFTLFFIYVVYSIYLTSSTAIIKKF